MKLRRALPYLLPVLAVAVLAAPVLAQSIPNPIGRATTIKDVLVNVLRALLGLLGILGVFMFIWGGYQFLLSGGNAESVKRGKATMFWASIGLAVIVGSWVLVRFILESASSSSN